MQMTLQNGTRHDDDRAARGGNDDVADGGSGYAMTVGVAPNTVAGRASLALHNPIDPGPCQPSFLAALVDIGPAIPTIAAVATVFAYVGGPTALAQELQKVPLVAGAAIAVVLGLVVAFVYSRVYTAADAAYPQSFADLRLRVDTLGARLRVLDRLHSPDLSVAEAIAYEEVASHYQALDRELVKGGPQWVTGSGYVDLLTRLHRAEEAMITIDPVEDVIAGAYYDEQRIFGSTIGDSADLLDRLRAAVQALSPSGSVYLKKLPRTETLADGTPDPGRNPVVAMRLSDPTASATFTAAVPVASMPSTSAPTINGAHPGMSPDPTPTAPASGAGADEATGSAAEPQPPTTATTATDEPAPASPAPSASGDAAVPGSGSASSPTASSQPTATGQPLSPAARKLVAAEARIALREVRHALNDFRDASRAGLVQSRSHILATMTLTGIITYVLLAFAVNLAVSPTRTTADPVAAAGVVYLVGAVVGLFNRLYVESGDDAAIEDYGLSRTRTLLTPMLSGLAAVGGVLLTGMLSGVIDINLITPTGVEAGPGTTLTRPLTTMSTIFNLEKYPFAVVLAAAFGLTPRLLLERLQSVSDQTRQNLKSTQANRPVVTAPADQTSGAKG